MELVYDKIVVLQKNLKENSKPGWEIWVETLMRNIRQQAKIIRLKKNAWAFWDEKEKATQKVK